MKTYSIAWWNLENYFDVENSPTRTEKLQRTLKGELKGWTEAILDRKTQQLAGIIGQLNAGKGPDLMGVCEVENLAVLQRLTGALADLGRNYQIAHHDTSDNRGIDVAFLYDATLFTAAEQFSHVIVKRTATRDLFQVNFRTAANRLLVVIGNHWPSRSAGIYESEPYRILAGETLSYFCQRIEEVQSDDTPILAMGDFNDEPSNRALTDYALSERNHTKVVYANTPKLLNLMWPLMAQGLGTHYYNNEPTMLDQFMVSGGMLKAKSKLKVPPDSVAVVQLPEMTSTGRYPAPIRFGRPSSGLDLQGFSDHFPIALALEEG
jgi:Endonuclease/Exonuclease/phosphatase family